MQQGKPEVECTGRWTVPRSRNGRTIKIQQGEQKVRISSDRITPAPAPQGEVRPKTLITPHSSPVTASDDAGSNEEENQAGYPEREAEYVVGKIVGVRQGADGKLRYRIRWYGYCRKAKFNCPLSGSPSGRPLIEAPNRAVLANSWNGYEGAFDHLFGVAIMVILVRVFRTVFFSLTTSEFS
jgi:hypothetical protein